MPPFLIALLASPLARRIALYVALALAALGVYKIHVHQLEAKAAQVASLTTEIAFRDTVIAKDSAARVALAARADSADARARAAQDSFRVVSALLFQRITAYNARKPVDVRDTAAVKVALAQDSVTIGQCSLVVRTCEQVQSELRNTISEKNSVIRADSVERESMAAKSAALQRATSIAPASPKSWWDRQPAYVRWGVPILAGAAAGYEVRVHTH